MKFIIALVVAGCIAATNGALIFLSGAVGNIAKGGDPGGAATSKANNESPAIFAIPLASVKNIIYGKDKSECINLCPVKVASTTKECIKPTDYPGYPRCYQINPKNKFIWPCTNEKKKKDNEED